ncbi:hypothetical protein V8E55_011614 [Tylopilus felleus]
MVLVALPPTIDSPQDFCFCGRETVETHDFLFCSTECARHDSLRSLGDPNCHYRNVVRDAYVRAGTPELQPRRMASAVHLRPGPSVHRVVVSPPPPFMPQTALAQQRNANLERIAPWTKYEAFLPTPSGTVPDRKATAGELAAGKHDQSRRPVFANVPSRAHPLPRPGDHTFGMNTPTTISPHAGPSREHAGARSLGCVPSSIQGRQDNKKQSAVAALLNFGRSPKGKEVENPEKPNDHPLNIDVPSARKERRMGRAL